jgi:U3 small nucleolar RNA-associated protein 13
VWRSSDAVGAVAFHRRRSQGAGGGFLVTGSADKTIKLWEVPARRADDGDGVPRRCPTTATQLAHEKDINAVAVAPNDRLFATASQDRTIKVWSTADCAVVGTCKGAPFAPGKPSSRRLDQET